MTSPTLPVLGESICPYCGVGCRLRFAGSPGGPTIISATLLSVINWMKLGMEAQAAINAPRFHHQWLPDRILMEQQLPPALEQALNAMGHATKRRGHIGLVNAIGIDFRSNSGDS